MGDRTSDAELVALAQSRNREAFGILVERHQPMVQRVAFGVVGQRSIAEELANEAMLQAYLSLDRLRDAATFQSWLHGIVLNVCRSYIRDRKRAPLSYEDAMGGTRYEGSAIVDIEPTPQELAESRELHQAVLHAVESLPPKARVTTLLHYYDQLSVREVADTLGMSESAVKNRLHSARARLREVLLPLQTSVNRSNMVWNQENREMIEVEITDVVEQRLEDKDTGVSWPVHVALLVDWKRRRMLPIWLGEAEGRAIAAGLKNLETLRPLTFSFVANLLVAADVQVEEVRIDSLKGDTYYAVVRLRKSDSRFEIDARPSDALALALQTGKPIYATEELLEQAGVNIPGNVKDVTARTNGARSILERFDQASASLRPKDTEDEEHHLSEARRESMRKSHDELIAALFGE